MSHIQRQTDSNQHFVIWILIGRNILSSSLIHNDALNCITQYLLEHFPSACNSMTCVHHTLISTEYRYSVKATQQRLQYITIPYSSSEPSRLESNMLPPLHSFSMFEVDEPTTHPTGSSVRMPVTCISRSRYEYAR